MSYLSYLFRVLQSLIDYSLQTPWGAESCKHELASTCFFESSPECIGVLFGFISGSDISFLCSVWLVVVVVFFFFYQIMFWWLIHI